MLFHVYLPFFLLIPMHGPAMGHRLPRAGSTPGMQRGGGGGVDMNHLKTPCVLAFIELSTTPPLYSTTLETPSSPL